MQCFRRAFSRCGHARQERCRIWHQLTGRSLPFHPPNLAGEYERLKTRLAEHRTAAVIHSAKQRAAPYSMKSDRDTGYSVNANATHNLLLAPVETGIDAHLGAMGVYGYSSVGAPIPEGYPEVQIDTRSGPQRPPAQPPQIGRGECDQFLALGLRPITLAEGVAVRGGRGGAQIRASHRPRPAPAAFDAMLARLDLPQLWRWQVIRVLHHQYEKPWKDHEKPDRLRVLIEFWRAHAGDGPVPDPRDLPVPRAA